MPPRQTRPARWPQRWLITDERMGENLWKSLARLPRGSGVVFRHQRLDDRNRARMGRAIARICRRRNLVLAVASDVGLGRRLGAALIHNPASAPGLVPHSRSVHDAAEAVQANLEGAAIIFVSPVFATRSHPDAVPLGIRQARELALTAGTPAIALGGMCELRWPAVHAAGFAGYAGIDCWIRT